MPAGTDLVYFLLSDGRPPTLTVPAASGNPVETSTAVRTLASLFTEYFGRLPDGRLEANTVDTIRRHQKQLEKHFGKGFLIDGLTLTDLRGYTPMR